MTGLTLFNKDFDKFFVGFDDVVARFNKFNEQVSKTIPNYPPYNIKKTEDNKYVIEMAVAGFGKSDIEVDLEGSTLSIRGKVEGEEEKSETLWGGLAMRPFTRTFTLNDQVEVKNAQLVNGMLKVWLEKFVPESTTKKIEVE